MRIIFNILSVLIVIAIVFLASLNAQTILNLTVWNTKQMHLLAYNVGLVQIILLAFIAGVLAGGLWAASFYVQTQTKLKEYQRKLEKTSVQSSEDSSKVAVLEAKIEVLEKALQSALEKNNE